MNRDCVRDFRIADGAEEDRVVFLESLPAVVGKDLAGLLVLRGTPRQAVPLESGAGLLACGFDGANRLVDDLGADAVSTNDCDAMRCEAGYSG